MYAGNRPLSHVGVRWSEDYLDQTSSKGYAVDGAPPELTHAGTALDAIEADSHGGRTLTQPEIDPALDCLMRAARYLPSGDALPVPRQGC